MLGRLGLGSLLPCLCLEPPHLIMGKGEVKGERRRWRQRRGQRWLPGGP